MSGVVGQKLARNWSALGAVEISVAYSISSGLETRQLKYVYDWVKPMRASWCMTSGRVKASARKITSGSRRCTRSISHSQNGNGLVWGLSTRNTVMPWSIQNSTTSRRASHSSSHAGVSKSSG